MSKTIYLFAGQGSQYPAMGRELFERYPQTAEIYECASDIFGFDMKHTCFEATESELAQTKYSQPAIFTTSLVALHAAKEIGLDGGAAAGHSLGEYAAMVASGIVSMEDGCRLIQNRAEVMQDCAEKQDGMMAAVLGLDSDELETICAGIDGYVLPVNYNSPAQTVIAGERQAVETAIELISEQGKKCVKLAVNAAFHSKLMQPAADAFIARIQNILFHQPVIPFYSNLTGELLEDVSDMPAYLAKHLVSPVQFVKEVNRISADGFELFVELGPNRVLSGLVRKTNRAVTMLNIENNKTLDKVIARMEQAE